MTIYTELEMLAACIASEIVGTLYREDDIVICNEPDCDLLHLKIKNIIHDQLLNSPSVTRAMKLVGRLAGEECVAVGFGLPRCHPDPLVAMCKPCEAKAAIAKAGGSL